MWFLLRTWSRKRVLMEISGWANKEKKDTEAGNQDEAEVEIE